MQRANALVQQTAVKRKTQNRTATNTNQSSSQSHSEGGKSSSSRGSGNNESGSTPSKKGVKKQIRSNKYSGIASLANVGAAILPPHISPSSPKPRSQATIQLITSSPSLGSLLPTSPKNNVTSNTKNRNAILTSHGVNQQQKNLYEANNSIASEQVKSIKKAQATPTIVFNLEQKPIIKSNQIEDSSSKKQNTDHPKTLGYKALISSGHLDFTQKPYKELQDEDQKFQDALHIEFLNKTLDNSDTQRPNLYINAPSNLAISLSKSPSACGPTQSLIPKSSIKQAITPPGEKLIIKKSEIRFGLSPSISPPIPSQNLNSKKVTKKQVHNEEMKKDSKKIITIDFIKKMLNDTNFQVKGGSPKKEGVGIRQSLSGGNSPYGNQNVGEIKKFQKSSINFVDDMKMHGIDKDIDSMRAMRQFIDNNSPQASISPAALMGNPQKVSSKKSKYEVKQLEKPLKIKTTFNVDNQGQLDEVTLGSAKSQESYQFPFHKRSRSMSPPIEEPAQEQSSEQTDLIHILEDSVPQETKQKTANQSRSLLRLGGEGGETTTTQQKQSNKRIKPGGPVIPDHQKMESVIRAAGVGSHGIISQQKIENTFSFSLKKHSKIAKKKANSQRAREQEELERRILAGTEVEDWLESQFRPQRAVAVIHTEEETKHSVRSSNVFQHPILRATTKYNNFANLGFIGDIDDLEEDDIEQDMAGNDDWMFQTFQNVKSHPKTDQKKDNQNLGKNSIDDLIPQNLLSSLDLGDNHIRLDDLRVDDHFSDADLEEGASIPVENMGRIQSLVSDHHQHTLDFPRQQQHQQI